MITVHIKLFATLLRYQPDQRHGQSFDLPLDAATDLRGLINNLALPEEHVKHVFVNGKRAAFDYRPHDGDEVAIFPPIAGG